MNQKEQIRKELNEYLDKYIPRTEIDIYKHVVNFIKKDRAKQLILSGVSHQSELLTGFVIFERLQDYKYKLLPLSEKIKKYLASL